MGCYAEYRCFDVDGLICAKPEGVTMEAAAALSFGGTTALDFFRRAGGVRPGWRVLVNGASGCVGGAAVQLAKHAGAEVTAVCSAANEAAVRGLGAAHVIDYARQPDITEAGAPYDVILDAVGNLPVERGLKALRRGGSLLLVVADLAQMLRAPWASWVSGRRVVAGPVAERPDDLRALAALASAGAFRPVIDRRFLLSQVAEAHRYVDTGRKRGSVILDVLG
jgi:NADPH:quinone reductase-like Zn-dependent oxidoreductase